MTFARAALSLAFLAAASGIALRAQQPASGAGPQVIQALAVQRNVTMLVAPSGNVVVQAGADGVLLVDAGSELLAAGMATAVRSVSRTPLHTIINSHADSEHAGGTGALVKMLGGGPQPPRVMAHDNVLVRLQREGTSTALKLNAVITLPVTGTYDGSRDFFLNGEAVFLHHAPAAHTDGDTIVHFRGSDVIAAGDIFTPDLYPVIDLQRGGSVNGLIAALNRILEIAVPARYQEGGTYVVPGHGRLSDEADVVEYRDMVTIIRDRVRAMIAKGMTLEQVQAARPSRDYDTEYGTGTGERFVEAVYRSLADARR